MRARSVLLLLAAAELGCSGSPPPADLVFIGGRVVTLAEGGIAEGIAVRGDRIVAVGPDAEIHALVGADTRVVELAGRTVIPGLADNHFHAIGGGPGVDLSRARTLDDVVQAIAARARETPPGEVVITNSDWHEGQLAEQRLPYRDDLDRATTTHPVVVVRGGHEYVLNSTALERWNIAENTAEPPGGRMGRYADGRLNGELVDRAKDLVSLPPQPARGEEERLDALESAYRTLNARGLTSVRHPGSSPEQYGSIRRLRDEGRLTVRVNFLLRAPRGGSLEDLRTAMERWPAPGEGDEWLRVGGVKLGVDGGFEGGLMQEPYEEPWGMDGTFHGLQTVPTDRFFAMVRELHSRGRRIATHAVGDSAIRLVLAAYEAADAHAPIGERRWVIEHGFLPKEGQFSRMRQLGLAVSAQNHLYVAAPSLVRYWGEERAAWTTPVRAYLDAGVPVSLGTDSPVIPWDPWWVLHHFTTRATISAGVLSDAQAITRLEALSAASAGYAYLTFEEELKGTLEAGKLADLVVTAEDVLACADPCLESMQVDMTVVGGRVVWVR